MPAEFADEGIARFVANSTLGKLDVAALRKGVADRAATRTAGPDVAHVHDVLAADRPARVLRPNDDAAAPVVLWLHGGGWTIGGLDSFDRVARRLALAAGMPVVLLDYRLAPEHTWPAQVDDTVEALGWLAGHPDALGFTPSAVAVGGDSAGGALAALACLRVARERPAWQPGLVALAYSNADLAGWYPSRDEKGEGFGLSVAETEFFNRQWVPDPSQWAAPGVSPLAADSLAGLPSALVVTAEHDHLRDEGAAFADRLRAEGGRVDYRCEPGLIHNFLMLDEISPAAAAAADRFAVDLAAGVRASTNSS